MGSGFDKELIQWSKGEYAYANNHEDDLAIIANAVNGFGYVADDAGNSRGSAAALNAPGGSVNQTGIISPNNDVDFYVFTAAAPSVVSINADPASISPNLDILLQLQNSSGTVLSTSNPDTALNAAVSYNVAPGTYYIKVQGTGRGDVLGDGYSNYGSIGHYSLSGSIHPIYDQQDENYDLGTYSEIFETNPQAVFSIVDGQGLNGTRGIRPLNTSYAINYLRKGPFDLSAANATLEISTFFKVSRPTSTNLGVATLELGFAQDQNGASFFSPPGSISWWLQPKSLIDTGTGFYFKTSVYVQVSNAGFAWLDGAVPILKSNNWYKATLQISRVNSTTLSLWGTIDDYGPTGQTYLSRVNTTGTSTATGSADYPFTSLTTDSTLYPALHGMSSGGLEVVDDTAFPKTTATVTLGSLNQIYDGSARSATATTSPAGLTVNFTYNGSSYAPTNAGSYTVIGTVNDLNYQGSATGTLVIGKATAPLTVTAGDESRQYGQTNPLLTGTVTGVMNGDNIAANYTCSATPASPPGAYPIVPSLVDPDNRLSNYNVATNDGILTVLISLPTVKYEFQADFDGRDWLVIQGGTARWQHFDFTPVGLHNPSYPATEVSSSVNCVTLVSGASWIPSWPNGTGSGAWSATYEGLMPALPPNPAWVSLNVVTGRGSVSIVQLPSAANTNTLIVEFNDDAFGSDALYDVQIYVATRAPLVMPAQRNGRLALIWSAAPGQAYQVQYKDDLTQPVWLDLGSPVTATNVTASSSDAITNRARFYRVRLYP